METVKLNLENYLLLKDKEKALNELLSDSDKVIILYHIDKRQMYIFKKSNEIIYDMDKKIQKLEKLNYEAKEQILNQNNYIQKIRKNKFLKFFFKL